MSRIRFAEQIFFGPELSIFKKMLMSTFSSIADFFLQGALWDESEGELMTHPLVSEVESFDDVISRRSIHPSISSSSINTVERCSTDDKALPDASIFGASSHFAGDMYMNGSGKAVILQ